MCVSQSGCSQLALIQGCSGPEDKSSHLGKCCGPVCVCVVCGVCGVCVCVCGCVVCVCVCVCVCGVCVFVCLCVVCVSLCRHISRIIQTGHAGLTALNPVVCI